MSVPFFEDSTTEFSAGLSTLLYNDTAQNSTTYNRTVSVCGYADGNQGYNYYRVSGVAEEPICLSVSVFSVSDARIAVLKGDCGSLSCVGQTRARGNSPDPSTKFFLAPDETYTIAVGHYYSNQDESYFITIEVSHCPRIFVSY